jgi:hypothetical protein
MAGRGLIVAGLLIVVCDLRVDGFDLISDPIGWILVLVALLGLTRLHVGFVLAAAAAGLGTLVGCGAVLDEPGVMLRELESIAMTGVVFGTCTAVVALAASSRDRSAANTIRWIDLGLTALGFVAAFLSGGETVEVGEEGALLIVPLLLLAFGVLIWFLVLVWRVDLLEEPAESPAASPT